MSKTKAPDHAELINAAFAAGKMVYSEWPLGITLAQAQDLAHQAATAGGAHRHRSTGPVRTRDPLRPRACHHRAAGPDPVHQPGRLRRRLGPVTDTGHAYLYDIANGATTLTASAMHALDAAGFVLGDPTDIRTTMAIGQHGVHLAATGEHVAVTAPDQVPITGRLPDSGVLSAFYRGGTSRAENFRWAITGTEGELLLTSKTPGHGDIQTIELQLTAAFGSATEMATLTIPDPDPPAISNLDPGPARNVARLYAALADDYQSFPDRGHSLIFDHGWPEIADSNVSWLSRQGL